MEGLLMGTEHDGIEFDALSRRVIGCALEVHRHLGPGLLETVYEQCLAHELSAAGIPFELQVPMPVHYKAIHLDCGFRLDVFVQRELIVELKCVADILPIHQAQLLTYMRLAHVSTGLLLNFNVRLFRDGIQRMVL